MLIPILRAGLIRISMSHQIQGSGQKTQFSSKFNVFSEWYSEVSDDVHHFNVSFPQLFPVVFLLCYSDRLFNDLLALSESRHCNIKALINHRGSVKWYWERHHLISHSKCNDDIQVAVD